MIALLNQAEFPVLKIKKRKRVRKSVRSLLKQINLITFRNSLGLCNFSILNFLHKWYRITTFENEDLNLSFLNR